MKKIIALFVAVSLTLSLAACGQSGAPASSAAPAPASSAPVSSEAEPASSEAPAPAGPVFTVPQSGTPVRVASLKGPTSIGLVKLMNDADGGDLPGYEFTMAGSPDDIVGKIIQGEYDVACVPTNLAATLFNKTQGKVQMTAITTMGILYLVERGDSVQSVADLAGKTVYATGKGSVPEFAFNYILDKNELSDSVTVEYKTEHTELANLLAAGQVDLAVLPQPFVTTVTMQNPDVRVALDLTEEWDRVANGESGLAMTAVIFQKAFLEEHPEDARIFLENYRASVEYVTDPANINTVSEMVVAKEIIPKAEVAKQAIPQCSIVFVDGAEMKTLADGFFKVLFNENPQSVGGTLPDESLYYLG